MRMLFALASTLLLPGIAIAAPDSEDTYSSCIVGGREPADGSPPTTNLAIGVVANGNTPKNQPVVNGGPTRMVRSTNGSLTQLEVEVTQEFDGDETNIAITWRHRLGQSIWSQIGGLVSTLPNGQQSDVIGFDIGDRLSIEAPFDGIACGAEWEFVSGFAEGTFTNGDSGSFEFTYGDGGFESPDPESLFKTSFFPRFLIQNGVPFTFSPPSSMTFNFRLRLLEPDCMGDLNDDGRVDSADIGLLIAVWGTDGEPVGADITGDGDVNSADLGLMIALWGDC